MGYFDSDAMEMQEVYLMETRQLSGQFSSALLDAEKKAAFSEEELHSVFRAMHTIKSSSAMMGLQELSSMTHKLEDLFSFYREEYGKISSAEPELFDLLFAVSDYIEGELERMTQEDYQPRSTAEIEQRTDAFLQKISQAGKASDHTAEAPAEEEKPAIPEIFTGKGGMVVRVLFESGCRMENVRAFMLIRQMTPLCTEIESYPPNLEKSQESAGYINKNGVLIRFVCEEKERVLELIRQGLFVSRCEILAEEQEQEEVQKQEEPQKAVNASETEFLQVRTERLDQLQNLGSELLISALSLDAQLEVRGLTEIREGVFHQINRLIADVEKTVMEMRLIPINRMAPRLRRILRDICRNEDKDVEFIVNCGDIEADKSVVDYVFEALIHILRNAVDHGIESPKEREALGKDKKGKISFQAETVSGELRISVTDDGRGIDEQAIRKRAREKGMFRRPEEEYSRREILEFVLTPGFTTNKEVTEYSGRGVGLDVVKSVLENAGGHLYMESEVGKGSTFTITVPLSLATMECTRFLVGKYRFSVPARYVFRFLEYGKQKENIREENGRTYILFESHMIPLVDFRRFFSIEGEYRENAILLYVKCVEKEGCFLVDSMYTQKRIVVKQAPAALGMNFRANTGISGFSVMGSGKICAALDIESLIGRYEKEGSYGRSCFE